MLANFKCKNCNVKITISDSQTVPNSCSGCGFPLSNPQYITSFFESYHSLQRGLNELEFCSLSSSDCSVVYDSDVENLTEVYNLASPEVKKLLTQILDKNFLMVYDHANDENIEELKKYKEQLNKIWSKKINHDNGKWNKLLDSTNN